MKNLLLGCLAAGTLAFSSVAQKDIEATMTAPTNGTTIQAGVPFDVVFTVTNAGVDDLVIDDSVYFAVTVAGNNIFGTNIYLADRTQTVVAAGESWSYTASGIEFATIPATATEDMCVVLFLYEGTAATPTAEPNTANNTSCQSVNFQMGTASVTDGISLILPEVSVYPNPASDVVTFETKGMEAANLVITSLAGKVVVSTSVEQATDINVSELESGVYFYTVSAENGSVRTGKLMVK